MQVPMSFAEVPMDKLRWRCDPASLPCPAIGEVPALAGIIGQERAQKALTMGIELANKGYNIYVCGMPGTGKWTTVHNLLATKQHNGVLPADLCYVFAFKSPERPRLLSLPAGQGKALKKAMEEMLAALKQDIPRLLYSANYRRRKAQHLQRSRRREQFVLQRFEERLAPHFGLLWHEEEGHVLPEVAPLLDGRLIPVAELEERLEETRISTQEYRQIRERLASLHRELTEVFGEIQQLRHNTQETIQVLQRALVRPAIHQAVAAVATLFPGPAVQSYLQEVEEALGDDIDRFMATSMPTEKVLPAQAPAPASPEEEDGFHEYQVNVIVDHAEAQGTSVIFETLPTYKNLFGTIEPAGEYSGVWRSDFMGIRAGALQRANGGYLVFNALDAFVDPLVWPALKRILRYGQSEIQMIDQQTLVPTTSLKPEPIPCHVKVVMIGNEELYDDLVHHDESFKRLFKVKADFDETIPRQQQTIQQYAAFMIRVCHEEGLRPCAREALAAVVERGVRLAGRQNKLSARLDALADVIREADYWAGKAGDPVITREAVERALQERAERFHLTRDRLYEMVAEGILLVSTRGAVVGQINGLALYEWEEDAVFGCPMRITATTSMGDAGVVNIEREADLSDPTHHKGVLIVSGYLRHAYGQDKPLILSASLCIEQSYEGIAGDSASAAEVYAMLSSLAACSVDQGIAVTGSVNQKGQIQPISGINEKIEGFFDICTLQGLTGTQGVILPYQNIDDLMLREDVIRAVEEGQFHLYPIRSIDDGLPILTGIAAGESKPGEGYPPDTVNGRVDAQLRTYAAQWYALQSGNPASRRGRRKSLSP